MMLKARVGDVTDGSEVRAAMDGVDAVVHMAALLHINPPPKMREKYVRVNVGGTEAVVDAAIKAGVHLYPLFCSARLRCMGRQGRVFNDVTN